MLANELIDRLERLGLLDQEIIEALREQLEQGGTRVTPEAVAKLLVDNGQLTHFQATKLIGELRSGQYEDPTPASQDEDLTAGLDDLAVLPDEADVAVEVVEPVDVFEAEPMVVEAVPVEAVSVESVGDERLMPLGPIDPAPARKKPEPQKSVWDSFKVYGYLLIIALLVLTGLGIWFVLSREDADEFIANANKLYDQQNYTARPGNVPQLPEHVWGGKPIFVACANARHDDRAVQGGTVQAGAVAGGGSGEGKTAVDRGRGGDERGTRQPCVVVGGHRRQCCRRRRGERAKRPRNNRCWTSLMSSAS